MKHLIYIRFDCFGSEPMGSTFNVSTDSDLPIAMHLSSPGNYSLHGFREIRQTDK